MRPRQTEAARARERVSLKMRIPIRRPPQLLLLRSLHPRARTACSRRQRPRSSTCPRPPRASAPCPWPTPREASSRAEGGGRPGDQQQQQQQHQEEQLLLLLLPEPLLRQQQRRRHLPLPLLPLRRPGPRCPRRRKTSRRSLLHPLRGARPHFLATRGRWLWPTFWPRVRARARLCCLLYLLLLIRPLLIPPRTREAASSRSRSSIGPLPFDGRQRERKTISGTSKQPRRPLPRR